MTTSSPKRVAEEHGACNSPPLLDKQGAPVLADTCSSSMTETNPTTNDHSLSSVPTGETTSDAEIDSPSSSFESIDTRPQQSKSIPDADYPTRDCLVIVKLLSPHSLKVDFSSHIVENFDASCTLGTFEVLSSKDGKTPSLKIFNQGDTFLNITPDLLTRLRDCREERKGSIFNFELVDCRNYFATIFKFWRHGLKCPATRGFFHVFDTVNEYRMASPSETVEVMHLALLSGVGCQELWGHNLKDAKASCTYCNAVAVEIAVLSMTPIFADDVKRDEWLSRMGMSNLSFGAENMGPGDVDKIAGKAHNDKQTVADIVGLQQNLSAPQGEKFGSNKRRKLSPDSELNPDNGQIASATSSCKLDAILPFGTCLDESGSLEANGDPLIVEQANTDVVGEPHLHWQAEDPKLPSSPSGELYGKRPWDHYRTESASTSTVIGTPANTTIASETIASDPRESVNFHGYPRPRTTQGWLNNDIVLIEGTLDKMAIEFKFVMSRKAAFTTPSHIFDTLDPLIPRFETRKALLQSIGAISESLDILLYTRAMRHLSTPVTASRARLSRFVGTIKHNRNTVCHRFGTMELTMKDCSDIINFLHGNLDYGFMELRNAYLDLCVRVMDAREADWRDFVEYI